MSRHDERPHWSETSDGRQRWDLHDDTRKALQEIEDLDQQRRELDNRITAAVALARARPKSRSYYHRNASWEQIGAALGISKQAAQKRYDRRLPGT